MEVENEASSQMEAAWKDNIITTLMSRFKFNDEESADICVCVGTHRIYVHKTVLTLNSDIIDQTKDKPEIDILPEFAHELELVTNILESFYTGSMAVNPENMKMVYKFSKCYNVPWLMDCTRPLILNNMPREAEGCGNFVEVFKFAHTVWCPKLMEACLVRLDVDLADNLIESKRLQELDFYCLKTIVSSESIYVPELKIFEMVQRWCEGDLEQRSCHIPELLSRIQYHRIDKDNLVGSIFDWVVIVSGIEEMVRMKLLIKVKEGIKNSTNENRSRKSIPANEIIIERPSDNNTRSLSSGPGEAEPLTPENDEVLKKLASEEDITPEELELVIKEKIIQADYTTQLMIFDYIARHGKITENNVTSYLKLYDVYKQARIIWACLRYIIRHDDERRQYNVDHIDWAQIPYSVIAEITQSLSIKKQFKEYDFNKKGEFRFVYNNQNSIDCTHGRKFYGATILEFIMFWALAHPQEKKEIKGLLKTVCYTSIPYHYMQYILLPSVQKLLPEITKLECSNHGAHTDAYGAHTDAWYIAAPFLIGAPIEVYLVQNYTKDLLECTVYKLARMTSTIYINNSKSEVYNNYNDQSNNEEHHSISTRYILFDRNMATDYYPTFRFFHDLNHLKRLTEKSSDLHLMVFPPLDYWQEVKY